MIRIAAVGLLAALVPHVAAAVSDLTVTIYAIHFDTNATVGAGDVEEGCAGATTGRVLLRFGTKVRNLGPDDLLLGDPGCPDCPTNPGAACTNPLFVCSAGLYVSHFRSAAKFELVDPEGTVVASGPKRGYCFHDDECDAGVTSHFTSCGYQGLTVGCVDDYTDTDPCQYLDVTGVPDVTTRSFTLRVTVDTDDLLPDPDRTNDVVQVALPGCGDGVVEAGEACDAGPTGGGCCDATCHLRAAGTVCRPAAGPCDAVETCDGVSAACPIDAILPDGAPCGGAASCVQGRCSDGACVTTRAPGMCVVDAGCFPDGAANPADTCETCDAGTHPDAWSPDRAPDVRGIWCTLDRIAAAVTTLPCGARLARDIAAPTRELRRMVAREVAGERRPRALVRLTRSLASSLARGARRHRCNAAPALAEVDALLGQVRVFAGASQR